MLRGLSRQIIFEDDEDYSYFINLLKRYAHMNNIKIMCYCLMINHVHLLVQDQNNNLSNFMQNLAAMYARYFNNKYRRYGTLFQRPYKKKRITTDSYLLSAYRYIIRNPENDSLCKYTKYQWSSYPYIFDDTCFVNNSVIKELLGTDKIIKNFLDLENDEYEFAKFFEESFTRITDSQSIAFIKKTFKIDTASCIRCFNKTKRDNAIKLLRNQGFTIRQIERLTGVSRGIIQNIR